MKRATLFGLVIVPLIGILFNVCGPPDALAQKPVELSLVTFGPGIVDESKIIKDLFVKRVNEEGKGKIKINIKGGPEVIPTFDQPVAVQKGLVDISCSTYTFLASAVPGSELFRAAEFGSVALRKRGADEFFRQQCAKVGLYYLGNPQPMDEKYFWILSKIKFQTKEDFKGHKIAGSPPFFAFFKGLGMVPQVMRGLKDYFPLMERGVVDAHIGSLGVFVGIGTYEVGKYVIDQPFFNSVQATVMNLKKWKSLPKDAQDVIKKVMLEMETTYPPVWDKITAGKRKILTDKGIEFYKLAPDIKEWYMRASIDAPWAEAEKRHPADLVAGYRKVLRK